MKQQQCCYLVFLQQWKDNCTSTTAEYMTKATMIILSCKCTIW